jgi:hypothetical protein
MQGKDTGKQQVGRAAVISVRPHTPAPPHPRDADGRRQAVVQWQLAGPAGRIPYRLKNATCTGVSSGGGAAAAAAAAATPPPPPPSARRRWAAAAAAAASPELEPDSPSCPALRRLRARRRWWSP